MRYINYIYKLEIMKHLFTIILFFVGLQVSNVQKESAFQEGEWFKFRVHYGLITAGYATLTVEDAKYKEKPVYHVKGFGETVGLSRFFFKVEDHYESYIDKETDLPYQFIRKINEGGHTKDKIIDFDQENHKAHIFNRKHDTRKTVDAAVGVQDMVSAFYYLQSIEHHNMFV